VRSFLDPEKLASDLDAMATTLSAFSISPEKARMAAQKLRDLQSEVERLAKQRDDAVNSTAVRYFTPPVAPPRRIIDGVEVERLNDAGLYRVRFGESVHDYPIRDWDAVTLYRSLVLSFTRELAIRLGVDQTIVDHMDESYRDDTIVINGIGSPLMAAESLRVATLTGDMPVRYVPVYDDPSEDPEPEGEYVNGEWYCSCPSCTRARENDADRADVRRAEEEAATAEAVARWRGADAADIDAMRAARRNIPVPSLLQPFARRLAEIMEGEMRTMSQPPGPPADPQYAEPESERAISESDENHWRTRGV